MTIFQAINSLCDYAINSGLIEKDDRIFCINRVIDILSIDEFVDEKYDGQCSLEEILRVILDYACENGLCENSVVYRDLFDTRIMGIFTPRPSQVITEFKNRYSESPESATDYYYALSRNSDYIR